MLTWLSDLARYILTAEEKQGFATIVYLPGEKPVLVHNSLSLFSDSEIIHSFPSDIDENNAVGLFSEEEDIGASVLFEYERFSDTGFCLEEPHGWMASGLLVDEGIPTMEINPANGLPMLDGRAVKATIGLKCDNVRG